MRRFVIGSHHRLAYGLRDTLEFLTCKENIIDISAYVDDTDAEEQIAQVFASIAPEDAMAWKSPWDNFSPRRSLTGWSKKFNRMFW